MRLHDLSRRVEPEMPVFPRDPPVSLDPHTTMSSDGYRVSSLDCGTHSGTHVDAPSHTEPDGVDIDAYDVERFVLDAVTVDLRHRDPRSRIGESVLPTEEADVVVLHTGWDRYWGEPQYFDHPFLTPEAADHCVEQGYDVAVDALNVDPTPTDNATDDEPEGFPAHHALLGADRLIFENLTGLSDVPRRFELVALPIRLGNADGAPVRAAARFDP